MPPAAFLVLRAVLVALIGAIATVVVSSFDRYGDRNPFDNYDE